MNIIHLASNKVWGGGERYALDLCERLRADGHRVKVIARAGCNCVSDKFREAGIETAEAPFGGFFDRGTTSIIAREIENMGGEAVVHVHNFKDARRALAARKKSGSKVRMVCTRHLVKPAKTNFMQTGMYRGIDALIFVSERARRAFMSTSPDIDSSKIFTVHNALKNLPEKMPLPGNDTPLQLIYIGSLIPDKGVDVLLHALSLLEKGSVHLDIYGTGAEEYISELKSIAGKLPEGTVHFHGFVSDIGEAMARSHAGVLPSVKPESFGLVLLEMMASGRPVITTDNGAQPEIVTDGVSGILVPPADAAKLADAIKHLAENRSKVIRMGDNASAIAHERFDYRTFYKTILKIYQPD